MTSRPEGRQLHTRALTWLRLDDARAAVRHLDEALAQLEEELFEQLPFFERQVPLRLLLEQREDVDHLARAFEVRLRQLLPVGFRHVAEVNGRGTGQ